MKDRLIQIEKMNEKKSEEISLNTWKVIEDSSFYSFNASHSYCVAGDSLYCAWLKANYPVQFYQTFMEIMEEDGNKDRIDLAKQEAQSYFGISFPRPMFGQDNRKIVGHPSKKEITQSLTFYKGFGEKIGEKLYDLSQEFSGDNFLDLLIFAEARGDISSKWEALIELDYFQKFGGNKKLLLFYKEFRTGKSKYSSKLTEKSRVKRLDELKNLWYNLPDEKLNTMEQIAAEIRILGRIESTFNVDKRYVYVSAVDTKYSPKITCQCLSTGKTLELKVSKKSFEVSQIRSETIIYCDTFTKKFGGRFQVNESGKKDWIEDKEKTVWWLDAYRHIKPNELS